MFNLIDNTVTTVAYLKQPLSYPGVAQVRDDVYIVGGIDDSNNFFYTEQCQVFNVKTGKVELIDPFYTAFSSPSLCAFNNNEYLLKIGGYNGKIKEEINNLYVELYDIKNNKWHKITNIKNTTAFKPVRTFRSGMIQLKSKSNTVIVFGGKEAFGDLKCLK